MMETRSVAAAVALVCGSLGAGAGVLADEQPDNGTIQEITVTARYRAENLQSTPISITALTAADLEARNVLDVTDLTSSTPSTSLVKEGSTGGNALVAYVRGVGQANYSLAFQPGVPIYLDDLYQPTSFGSLLTLGDVERVEVLRGPQGTLFGKNSEGGAVNIRSVDPKGDNSGFVEAGAGSYAGREFRGAFDFALLPNQLFVRVAAGTIRSDGYVTREDYVCAHPAASGTLKPAVAGNCTVGTEGGIDDTYGRIAVKWLPNDDLTVRLSVTTEQDDDEAVPEVPLIINPAYPGSDLAAFNTRVSVPLYGIPISSAFLSGSPYRNYATFTNPSNGFSFSTRAPEHSYNAVGKVDWNLPFNLLFTSITGFKDFRGLIPEYKDGPIPINMVQNTVKYASYSEEDRISGTTFGSRLDWTAGIYYFHGSGSNFALVNLPISQVGPFFGINETLYFPTSDQDQSAYLHAVYHITDKLGLEAGVRYSHDVFSYIYTGTNLAQVPANPIKAAGTPVFGLAAIPVESKDSRFDPKVALEYQWTPDLMTYAQYATGFKGGGTNPTPITAAQATPFGIEKLGAYEVGAKSQWFDRHLQINADGYYNDVTGLQLIGFAPSTIGGTVTLNAGHAIVKGIETEIEARPIAPLSFSLSGSYLDFKYHGLGVAAFSAANPGGLRPSDVAPYSPKWKGSLGTQYEAAFGSFGTITPRLDYTYTSRVYFDPQNNILSSQSGYGMLNGRLSWAEAHGKLSAAVEGNNLTNKVYYLSMFNQLSSFGILTGQPGIPRNYMLTLRYNF